MEVLVAYNQIAITSYMPILLVIYEAIVDEQGGLFFMLAKHKFIHKQLMISLHAIV